MGRDGRVAEAKGSHSGVCAGVRPARALAAGCAVGISLPRVRRLARRGHTLVLGAWSLLSRWMEL